MGEKSAKSNSPKTAPAKTLKEKRLAKNDKKASAARDASQDAITKATKKK